MRKALLFNEQDSCISPVQTEDLGQHSRGQSTTKYTVQVGHFQPVQVHILTRCKKSSGHLKTIFLRSTNLGISDTFLRDQFSVTPKGICGTLVKEKKFPEMRPLLLTVMVTVHKGASQNTAMLASAALHKK